MSLPPNKEARKIARQAVKVGWRCDRTKNGHYRLLSPCGQHIVVLGSTPSDSRSFKNSLAELRRAGLQVS